MLQWRIILRFALFDLIASTSEIVYKSGPQLFWHQGSVSWNTIFPWKTIFPWTRVGVEWFQDTVYFISIIMTSAPPQSIRHHIPEVGTPGLYNWKQKLSGWQFLLQFGFLFYFSHILAGWVFAVARAFSSCGQRGLLSSCGAQVSQSSGFFCYGTQALE